MDEYLVLARLLIACAEPGSDLPDAWRLIGHLRAMTERTGLLGKSTEVAVLEALAWHRRGDLGCALSALERALSRASETGYVQVFLDEGRPMAELLYKAASQGISPRYAGRLLAAFEDQEQGGIPPRPREQPSWEWIEPLSERELEVLDLIAQGFSNREVARALSIALSTVKVHTHNIYGKLDVHSRTQAVAKARAMGILPSTH
jgi:LuxR family maltose regulon positive regulatory protein